MQDFTSLTQVLSRQHNNNEKTIAFIRSASESISLSFGELYRRAINLLAGFQGKGVSAQDEVILYTDDDCEFLIAFWACLYGAMIPVPVAVGMHREHQQKLFSILSKLKNPFIFTEDKTINRITDFANQTNQKFRHSEHFLRAQDAKAIAGKIYHDSENPDQLAFIQFSSGSTREPKGVMLSHQNLVSNINAMRSAAQYTEKDKILSWMPLTHDMGLIGMHLAPTYCGMDHCLMSTRLFSRRPLLWMTKASETKSNILCSPNFGYKHYLKALGNKELENIDLSSVRLIYNGAEPISTELCRAFLSRLAPYGLKSNSMFLVYGLAEATLAVSFPEIAKDFREVHVLRDSLSIGDSVQFANNAKSDSVGFAMVGKAVNSCQIRIANRGHAAEEGVIGEIHIKGEAVTKGYYLDDQASKDVLMAGGWLNTGDLGFMNQGELVITGRAKEIIFANGQNFYPHDVEDIIQQKVHIELGRVVACGVRQDREQSEQLIIFLVYRGELGDFQQTILAVNKAISEQLGLEVYRVIPVKTIPKTTSGKLQRGQLARAYLDGKFDEVVCSLYQSDKDDVSPVPSEGLIFELIKLFKSVVSDKSITVDDDLFEVGISSLQLAEIHQRIEESYPGLVDITELFEFNTLAKIANLIEEKNQKT